METTGTSIRSLDNSWLTVISMNQRTGLVPENANTHGNVEVLDNVKVKAGAMVTMPVKRSTNELT